MRVWALFPSCIVVTSHSGNCQIELRLAQKPKKSKARCADGPRSRTSRGPFFSTPLHQHHPPPNPWLPLLSAPPMRCIPARRGHACSLLPLLLLWVVRGRLLLVSIFGWTGARARARGKKARTSAPQQRTVRVLSCLSFPLSLCVFFG